MEDVAESGRPSSARIGKRRTRLWPIPPLGRVGVPRAIVNADPTLNKGGAWRPTSPCTEPAYTRSHCSSPVSARLPSPRSTSTRSNAAWEVAALQPSLLEALGILSTVAGETAPSRLGRSIQAHKLKDLQVVPQECEEGCYWRWLVHTLLEDVAVLKRNFEDCEEARKLLAEKKVEIEKMLGDRDNLTAELDSMSQALLSLRVDVPKLRHEHEEQQKESRKLKERHHALEDKQRELQAAIRRSVDWQRSNIRRVQAVVLDADEGRRREQSIRDRILNDQEKVHQSQIELQYATADYQALQAEMKEIEEKRSQKRAIKKGKGAKK